MQDEMLVDIMQRHARLLSLRSGYESSWEELADHFLPTRYRNVSKNPSDYKGTNILNPKLINTTGVLASRTLAAGLQGGMTSPARPWFALDVEEERLRAYEPIKEWLGEVQKRMRNVLRRSNFYNVAHTAYGDLGVFGTTFLLLLADFDYGIRFVPFSVGEYCIDVNSQQKVDVVFRRFQMSARQLVQQFGKNKVPEYVLDHSKKARSYANEGRYVVVHAIYPRSDYSTDPQRRPEKMPYASIYYLEGMSSANTGYSSTRSKSHLLQEGGFEEFPGFGIRWDVVGSDIYGRSPAMDVLADCKMLQQIDISTLKAIHKSVDPPTSVNANLKATGGLDLTPGGVNYVETLPGQAPQAAVPILQMAPEIQASLMAEEKIEQQIKAGMYNDLFRMLLGSDRRQITAREVEAKEDEKLILIGPVLERLNNEFFIPLFDRLYNVMKRLNMLPPIPEIPLEYGDIEIKVQFVSLLAQAQKAVAIGGIDRFMAFIGSTAQMFPEALDAPDIDEVIDEYAESLGLTPTIIKALAKRDEARKARQEAAMAAQQQEQAQAQGAQTMQMMQGAGDLAYKLSQSNVEDNSALTAILGGGAGGAL